MGHRNTGLSAAERFEMKVDRSGECHRWTGARHGKGYGHFRYEGKVRKAHVVALLLAGVDVPEGMTVDHVWARGCQFKDCVRVEHLEVVSNHVNILRGGNACADNARKTHCLNGHEFTPENTVSTQGGRQCRECKNERSRQFTAKRRSSVCDQGHQKVTSPGGKLYCPPCFAQAHTRRAA